MDEPGPQGRSTIRDLLAKHGIRPNQSYGQNFLVDPNVIRRIVRLAAVDGESRVIEIGGGTGTLTGALAATGALVVAYEIDSGLVRILEETVGGLSNVEVRHDDASRVRFDEVLDGESWTLVANLPYNVGTGITLDVLRHAPSINRLVIMVQREVADRLLAAPGSRSYGIPSVITALHAQGSIAFTAPPTVFYPAPAVDSTVVELTRHPAPDLVEPAIEIANAAFGQRRKMLRRSLADAIPGVVAVLERCGVDPMARPESLSPDDFVMIAEEMGV